MIIRDRLINRPSIDEGVENFDGIPSLAKPNREITIKKMLKLHMSGQPLPACGLNVYYDDNPTFDKSVLNKIGLDLTDLDVARQELFFRQQAIAQGVETYQSALKDRETFESSEKFKKRYEQYFNRKFEEQDKEYRAKE